MSSAATYPEGLSDQLLHQAPVGTGGGVEWDVPEQPTKVRVEYATRVVPSWVPAVVRQIDRLSSLPSNWDSYGAPPVDQHCLVSALHFLAKLLAPDASAAQTPALVPTSAGGVQIEWHREGKDLEIRIDPGNLVSAAYEDAQQAWERDALTDLRIIESIVSRLG